MLKAIVAGGGGQLHAAEGWRASRNENGRSAMDGAPGPRVSCGRFPPPPPGWG